MTDGNKNVEIKQLILNEVSRILNITLQPIEKMMGHLNLLDSSFVHKIVNHPAHIVDDSTKELSSSALIPFCQFGGWIGVNIKMFDVPVCNSFQAQILNNQLCYIFNPNRFKELVSSEIFKRYN